VNPYWSWILTAVGVIGLYYAGKKRAVGWGIGVLAQLLWVTYAITTRQWGFVGSALIYGWVYTKNFFSWIRPLPATNSDKQEDNE